jgi:hypothetical protein
MAVMGIRHVRMRMPHRLVPMPVAVRPGRHRVVHVRVMAVVVRMHQIERPR